MEPFMLDETSGGLLQNLTQSWIIWSNFQVISPFIEEYENSFEFYAHFADQ